MSTVPRIQSSNQCKITFHKWRLFNVGTERKVQNLTENSLLEYLLSVHVCSVLFPGIYLRTNIPLIKWKELSLVLDKIWAEYYNDCWKK
jgi:hypothetical protein